MLLGGLWHGANWTYVIWGALHGGGLAAGRLVRQALGRPEGESGSLTSPRAWVQRVFIFHLVCLGWVFFRSPSLADAFHMLGGLRVLVWRPEYGIALKFLAMFVTPLLLMDLRNERYGEEYVFESTPYGWRFATGLATMALITLFSANQLNAFIYFRF